jgi:hypothetical protein
MKKLSPTQGTFAYITTTFDMLRLLPLRQTAFCILRFHEYKPIVRFFTQNAVCLRNNSHPKGGPVKTTPRRLVAEPLMDFLRGTSKKDLIWMDRSKI